MPMLPESRNDKAVGPNQNVPFAIGAVDKGMTKGSQGQFKRESRPVATGSFIQPVLRGTVPYQPGPSRPDKY